MNKNYFNLIAILFFLTSANVVAQPVIISFSPTSGPIGTTVIITGTNFNATAVNNVVYFGAVKATVTAATTTSLNVTVTNRGNICTDKCNGYNNALIGIFL